MHDEQSRMLGAKTAAAPAALACDTRPAKRQCRLAERLGAAPHLLCAQVALARPGAHEAVVHRVELLSILIVGVL